MNYSKESQELDFAYKVRHALNQSAENLPPATLDRLAAARKQALSRKRADSPIAAFLLTGAFAGSGTHSFQGPSTFLGKMGLLLPLVVLIVFLFGIFQHEQQRHISELAELDTAVLADELPPDAYLDTGFSTYLSKSQE